LDLQRQAKAKETEAAQLEAEFAAELKATGKPSIKRFGFTLAWIKGKCSVAWKEAFLKECGNEKATALQKAAADKDADRFSITPPEPVKPAGTDAFYSALGLRNPK
jgi:hypothetical protein